MAGQKAGLKPMWKKLMSKVDLEEPTSIIDKVYLGCTQLEKWNKQKTCGRKARAVHHTGLLRHEHDVTECNMQHPGTTMVI